MADPTTAEQLTSVLTAIANIEVNCQGMSSDEINVRYPNYKDLCESRDRLIGRSNRKPVSTFDMSLVG